VLTLVLLLRPFGNLCLAWGMKHLAEVVTWNPLVYLRAMANPFVAAGILMLVLGLLLRMALLSMADLSCVLPLTAGGYILSTLLGRFVLSEDVSWGRWLGTAMIISGAALVSTTSRKTTRKSQERERYEPVS